MGLFDKIKKVWSQDMAIDLGTANTLVVVKGQGVVNNSLSFYNNQCISCT